MCLFINVDASSTILESVRTQPGVKTHTRNIVETYKYRKEKERYSRKVSMEEIEKNGYNLNISRYVSTSEDEVQIDLNKVNESLTSINERIKTNTDKHNEFLKELGLKTI
ncbi:MAG: N-6 DNA methylase [Candidatus Marinimicrobia bacterium]|nr:N-6 DNA methylase [Candidatus Neomarinimicrobiota bacterium]